MYIYDDLRPGRRNWVNSNFGDWLVLHTSRRAEEERVDTLVVDDDDGELWLYNANSLEFPALAERDIEKNSGIYSAPKSSK